MPDFEYDDEPVVAKRPASQATTMVVGSAHDPAEHEADRVADAVMRVLDSPGPTTSDAESSAGRIRRSRIATRPTNQPAPRAPTKVARSSAAPAGEAIGAEGGPVDQPTASRIQRKLGRGAPLDGALGSEMEHAFGRSFDDVRVHTDSESAHLNQELGARAFTTGSDIFFGRGELEPNSDAGRQVVAHELSHVVQNSGGLRRTSVIRRWSPKKWLKKKVKGTPTTATLAPGDTDSADSTTKTDTTTAPVADTPVAGADTAPVVTGPPPDLSLADSIAYEQALGRFMFNHPVARFAAAAMIDRLITAVNGEIDLADKENQAKIAAQFGRDKASSAGQVGTEYAAVWAALNSGNLREKMTAIYNVMFGGVKNEIISIMERNAWGEAEARGFDKKKLKRRKRQMKTNVGAKDLYRDPGNPLDRKNFSSYAMRGTTRDAVEGYSERTVGDLEDDRFGIGLSDREKKLQFGDETDVDDEKLKWQEGGTYWKPRQDNKWVKKVTNDLHMPVLAGPSGTSLRLWQVWEFLGKPIPAAHWRAAIIGWMLTANDHSFHEMMMVATDYGLPYKSGVDSYRKIDPFGEPELRVGAAVGGMFPDELAFSRKVRGGAMNLVTEHTLEAADQLADDEGLSEHERTAVIALLAYTDEDPSGYKFMNNASSKMLLGPRFFKFIREDKYLKDKYAANKFKIKDLAVEAQDLTKFATQALGMSDVIEPYDGTVYRGFKTFRTGGYTKGKVMNFSKFMSFSAKRKSALPFTRKGVGFYGVMIELESKTGVNIADYSLIDNEAEVLFRPGSKFKVEEAPTKQADGLYVMKWSDQSPTAAAAEIAKDASEGFALKHLTWDADAEAEAYEDMLLPEEDEDESDTAAPAYDPSQALDYGKGGLMFPDGSMMDIGSLSFWSGDDTGDSWYMDVRKEQLESLFALGTAAVYQFCVSLDGFLSIGPDFVRNNLMKAYAKHMGK